MKNYLKKINPLTVIGWILTLSVFFPLYIMIINSFKNRNEIFTDQLKLPSSLDFTYYIQAIRKMNFGQALMNSLFITIISVIILLVLSSMAAWVLVRTKTPVSGKIFYVFVATMLIPFQSVMIPLVQYMSKWQSETFGISFIDTRYGLIFMNIGFGLGFSIFLFHGFIKNIPVEMEEAAMIDGSGKWQMFWKIVFPSLKPITVTSASLNVISLWNDYLLPSLVLRRPQLRTIPLSTFYFFGEFTIQWNLALAGLLLAIVPVIIFYLFAQRYIIEGVMSGAIK